MVMKLGADWAVDDPGLEARVRIAEGYRGGHIANVMETMLTRWISGLTALSPISYLDLKLK